MVDLMASFLEGIAEILSRRLLGARQRVGEYKTQYNVSGRLVCQQSGDASLDPCNCCMLLLEAPLESFGRKQRPIT